ncbi:DUF4258 domain-containing protein [Polaribacter sp.]|uniref:DUF4258 domain-containing protein n=1 Tax=Polaribacter sp. TaxID=1920175 RepID=UPI0025F3CBA1|nr:DUF4258 domain-containing protein [Polaribacter sp.]
MLLKRIGYFLVGVSISSIGVYFFWQKKNTSFDYGMDARTLKTIRIRERIFSNEAKMVMNSSKIDSLKIERILNFGDVDFGKSQQRKKPCAEYYITGKKELKNVSLYVIRCDYTATIKSIFLE